MESRRMAPAIRGGFGAGVGAALIMILVMAVLRLTTNTMSIPELMEDSLIRISGGEINSFFINALGVGGKALLIVTVVEGMLLLGGLLGLAFTVLWPARWFTPERRWNSGLWYGLIVGALLNVIFLPLVGQGFFGAEAVSMNAPPEISRWLYGSDLAPFAIPVAALMFILSFTFGVALVRLLPWPRTAGQVAAATAPEPVYVGRREFLRYAAGTTAALFGGVVLWGALRQALAPPPVAGAEIAEVPGASGGLEVSDAAGSDVVPRGFEGVKPRLVPEITPTDKFYITTKNFVDPTVDGGSWSMSIGGLVDKPYSLTLPEVLALPVVERVHTLACISNPVGGDLIGNGRWRGVDFGELIRRAQPRAGVVDVVVKAADGYTDSFSLDAALNNGCVLAYEMNGEQLNHKHGYPVRLLVPGIFGMKNVKWITEVELVDRDHKGYWQSQGWSDPAPYMTMSRIDYPNGERVAAEPLYIGGIAFAGERGIQRVEVSTDDGGSWADAQLRPPTGEHTWVLWTYPWNPAPGSYTLKVRATDGTGEVQTSKETNTYPDGATGYHTRRVRVS